MADLSEHELAEWMAFYALEPWGGDKDDWRTGQVCATMANIHRDPKKGRTFQPGDFMPPPADIARSEPRRMDDGTSQERARVASNVIAFLDGWNERRERRG